MSPELQNLVVTLYVIGLDEDRRIADAAMKGSQEVLQEQIDIENEIRGVLGIFDATSTLDAVQALKDNRDDILSQLTEAHLDVNTPKVMKYNEELATKLATLEREAGHMRDALNAIAKWRDSRWSADGDRASSPPAVLWRATVHADAGKDVAEVLEAARRVVEHADIVGDPTIENLAEKLAKMEGR